MVLSGPAPSRADWSLPRWPCLINKFSGERRRTRSRRVRPGNRPARRSDPGPARPSRPLGEPREALAGGSTGPGSRELAEAGRAPARPKPMLQGWPELRLEWGSGSAWPRLLL